MNRNLMIKKIKTAQRYFNMDDATYRNFLFSTVKRQSCTECADFQLAQIINAFEKEGFRNVGNSRATRSEGKYAPVLKAVWLSGWNLGVVRSRDDAAMIAFVQRQTGVSHTRFLTDGRDARKAIEGMKRWIARESSLEWPGKGSREAKKAVVRAQWRRLFTLGETPVDLHSLETGLPEEMTRILKRYVLDIEQPDLTEADFDKVQVAFGKKIRSAMAKVA